MIYEATRDLMGHAQINSQLSMSFSRKVPKARLVMFTKYRATVYKKLVETGIVPESTFSRHDVTIRPTYVAGSSRPPS